MFGVDELPSPASVLATFSSGQPLIAPLVGTDPGADFQEQNRFHYRNTTDAATLDKVVNVTTASNPSLVKYEPIFAVVITWFLFDPDQDVVSQSVTIHYTRLSHDIILVSAIMYTFT